MPENTYRAFLVMNGKTHFTKKMSFDDATMIMHGFMSAGFVGGIIDGDAPLPNAETAFTTMIVPSRLED